MAPSPLRIVADANVPHALNAFQSFGSVALQAGQSIRSDEVADAEVLVVRSVTNVDQDLLQNSPVRFVGSATIGTDHVDQAYLSRQGIAFAHAPGSNAQSVVEYVLAALLAVHATRGRSIAGETVSVIGCGHIGRPLAGRLPSLGARVLRCDPPLAEADEAAGRAHGYVSLDTVLAEADVVTLHTPLTRTGPHATHHLIGADELAAMKPDALLVNASRGAVVDNAALRDALGAGQIGGAVLDVWEHEPTPDPDLLRLADIATPHIAGYSFDGKVRGTAMLHDALAAWLGVPPAWDAESVLAEDLPPLNPPDTSLSEVAWLGALVRQAYDLRADNVRMRRLLERPAAERGAAFHRLRRTYPRRRAWERHRIAEADVPTAFRTAVADGLGFEISDE
ncbi:MAG: 4-phosphoerythronate dehydrogenase [Bacteroidota bacterium]